MGIRITNVVGLTAEEIEDIMDVTVERMDRKARRQKQIDSMNETSSATIQMKKTFEESRKNWELRRADDRNNKRIELAS